MSTGGARMGVSGHVAHLEIVASDGGATVSLYNTHYIAFVTAFKAPYRAQDESPDGAATVTARVVHVEYFHKSRNSYAMASRDAVGCLFRSVTVSPSLKCSVNTLYLEIWQHHYKNP